MGSTKRMGRPTKYKRRFIKEAEKYLQECENQRKIPWIEEFAERCEVSEDSIARWRKANDEFSFAVGKIMNRQCMALKVMGLKSPAMLIFLLEANHGMVRAGKRQREGAGGEHLNIVFTDSVTSKHAEANQ